MDNQVFTGGNAFHAMLSDVQIDKQRKDLLAEIKTVKSPSKRDVLIKQLKYLSALDKMDLRPENAYILNHMPVIPPITRPPITMPGNRIEYADANQLYKEHFLANQTLDGIVHDLPDTDLVESRSALYNGAKAVMGLGDALSGSSRGKGLQGFLTQIGGKGSPKGGFFQSRILSKKLDFSGRGTIYAEPALGFNEAAIPKEMLWTMYAYHIIRNLTSQGGYTYPAAKLALEQRTPAAQTAFNRITKQIPLILNRAPTLMASNTTAMFPVPIDGKTIGLNPQHLLLFAGDYDGDALSVHCPITPEAIEEARKKLLPEHHAFDARRGQGSSLILPGHEGILGALAITEPNTDQKTVTFESEEAVLEALRSGEIKENTPIRLKKA